MKTYLCDLTGDQLEAKTLNEAVEEFTAILNSQCKRYVDYENDREYIEDEWDNSDVKNYTYQI